MTSLRTLRTLFRAVLAAAVISTAPAQFTQRSAISGLVTDESGTLIPNATITLTDLDRNQTYKTTTNERGLYTFTNLTASRYSIAGEFTGFKRAVSEAVTLSAGSSVRVDLRLEVGAVTESI